MRKFTPQTFWLSAATIVAAGVVTLLITLQRNQTKSAAIPIAEPEPLIVPRGTVHIPATQATADGSARAVLQRPTDSPIASERPAPRPNSSAQPQAPRPNNPAAAGAVPPVAGEQPIVALPVARQALSWVGADADAEEVWVAAINDPNMPPEARKDLIEDLNEEGFEDPKHLTRDDLPLIVNRLQLIEQLAPDSVDDTNAAAFAEAYKDLLHMFAKLAQ
jgi:hypothetical protein